MFEKIFSIKSVDCHKIFYIFNYPVLKLRSKILPQPRKMISTTGLDTSSRNRKLIVSLTSFPARINKVHLTIETLLQQSIKPNKLILWLSNEEFPNRESDLPETLLNLQRYGLSIEWCDYMRSYQKLIPALNKYSDDIIVTFDDDFYYPDNILEDLYFSYLKHPEEIHAHRIWRMTLNKDHIKSVPNNDMFMNKFDNEPSYFNMLMGYGGVLYPPHSLSNEIFNVSKFRELIPTHDDVWFWFMSILGRTKIRQVNGFNMSIFPVEGTQEFGLCNINKKGNSYGISTEEGCEKLLSEYPQIKDILEESRKNEKKA